MCDSDDLILNARGIHHTFLNGDVETPVLHGIDLEIRRGEFIMLTGPSGCGKSTLLNILGLMMQPSEGTVELDGTATTSLTDGGRTALRRDKLGFIFQRFNLLPVLTAEQNVAIALKLRGERLDGQPARALERVGLAHKRRSKPGMLSVGEQQRVAIARAVVSRPSLVLADEPTGNLDSKSAEVVLELLRQLNQTDGVTVLMITHNEQWVDRADRVLAMRDGRITHVRG